MILIDLQGLETEEDGLFGLVLRPDLDYQIRLVENIVMTGTKGRKGRDFDCIIIMRAMWNMEGSPNIIFLVE